METVYDFRMRIAPRWDVLAPLLQERAQKLGLTWPKNIKVLQFAKMYAVSLVGQQRVNASHLVTKFDVLAWTPPKEPLVAEHLSDFSALRVSLGVRQQKAWREANAGREIDFEALGPMLSGDGLVFTDAHASQRLTDIPYQPILRVMSAVASKKTRLNITHSDHIVEHLSVPADLSGFKLSHWRGDASYRLSHPHADLEIWVKPQA